MEASDFPHGSELIAEHIHAKLADRGVRVGPFVAGFDAADPNPWRNYAAPDHRATPSPDEVVGLIAAFEERGRIPRLEYVPAAAPAVEAALLAAGFTVEGRPPLMACAPDGVCEPPEPDGIEFLALSGDAELLEAAAVQNLAYGMPEPPGEADLARMQATIARGGIIAAARLTASGAPRANGTSQANDTDGARGASEPDSAHDVYAAAGVGATGIVGAALVTAPLGGVRELAAVAVAEPFRRRGIAAALTAYLTRSSQIRSSQIRSAVTRSAQSQPTQAPDTQLVFLEPAGPDEQRIYARCGFAVVGEKLWISRR